MSTSPKTTIPVWFLSAIAIVVVLAVGMVLALLDPSQDVDQLDQAVYPPGAKIKVEGDATVLFTIGQRTMSPGWFAVGTYPYVATFADGQVAPSAAPLLIVDKLDVTLVCEGATHTCAAK